MRRHLFVAGRVLLLEAGRASHPWSPIPIGMARLIANPAANWLYSSEPEANTNGRRLPALSQTPTALLERPIPH
jgi:choline dehydrogenase-like flavoprotein